MKKKPAGPFTLILYITAALSILFFTLNSCVPKGLVSRTYSEEFYKIPPLINIEAPFSKNPVFIFYGDPQLGWRAKEKFLKRKNWLTWKMLLFPFYEIYWIANGVMGGINYIRSAPDFGLKEQKLIRDAMYSETKQRQIDFIINAGDLVSDGRRPKQWETFLKTNKTLVPLLAEIPFLAVRGNHDRTSNPEFGERNYSAIFDFPPFYVLKFPDVSIFVLDSQIILDGYQAIEDDLQDQLFQKWFVSDENANKLSWLEKELFKSKAKYKIVGMHHPPVSFGKHFHDWRNPAYGRNLELKRQKLLKLFQKHKVQVVLSGHEHFYEHNLLHGKSTGNDNGSDMHIIVSGSGGAPVRDFKSEEAVTQFERIFYNQGFEIEMVRHDKIYNYLLITTSPLKLNIKVIEVTGNPENPTRIIEEININ